jgi:hypothetical protein
VYAAIIKTEKLKDSHHENEANETEKAKTKT